jgi:hypothetical protein
MAKSKKAAAAPYAGDVCRECSAPAATRRAGKTTYAERFMQAIEVLCGGTQPPLGEVAAWLDKEADNHDLQEWVVNNKAVWWAQGIAVLDAAHVLADQPEEGEGHEDRLAARPPQAQPAAPSAEQGEALIKLVNEFGRVSDNVGRSRGSNNYAVNTGAVERAVQLQDEIDAAISALATQPAAPVVRKSLSASVADALRPFLSPGQKVIWREPFRWFDDDGVLSNHYDGMSVAALAADFGYEVHEDCECAAIISKRVAP